MVDRRAVSFAILTVIVATSSALQIGAGEEVGKRIITTYSPFSTALETLQKQIKGVSGIMSYALGIEDVPLFVQSSHNHPVFHEDGNIGFSFKLINVHHPFYTFYRIDLLRRAMTHASFSEENNRALSILGTSIIETSVSFRYLLSDIDISSKTLNREIAEVSNVESSCAVDGMRLGLHKVIRVSHKTNSTTPAIVCGAFRSIFGAIALDSGKSDDAAKVFWNVHTWAGELAASF